MKTIVYKYSSEEGEGSTKDGLLKVGFLPEKKTATSEFSDPFLVYISF